MDLVEMFQETDQTKEYPKDTFIFQEGEASNLMYVILEGEVDILLGDKVVASFTRGDIFGEMALIDTGPRSAGAIAKTDCKLVYIDRDNFLYLIQHTPLFGLYVMETLTSRIRELDKHISPKL